MKQKMAGFKGDRPEHPTALGPLDRPLHDSLVLSEEELEGSTAKRFNPIAYAAAAVLLVGVWIGLQGPDTDDRNHAVVAETSPTPARVAQRTTRPATSSGWDLVLRPPPGGPVRFAINDLPFRLFLPEGWGAAYGAPDLIVANGVGALAVTTADHLDGTCFADGAGSSRPLASPSDPARSTRLPGVESESSVAFTLDGYPGRYFAFGQRTRCHPNPLWSALAGDAEPYRPYMRLQLWILEVDAETIAIGAYTGLDTPQEELEEVRRVVASLQVRPPDAPGALLTPYPYADLWAEVTGSHGAALNRIRFSYSVPSGWSPRGIRPGSLSVNKSSHGSQGAEGIVYWAPLAGSPEVSPCERLVGTQPVGSLESVAAVVADADGTTLVAGPTETTVGGRRALYLVVAVQENEGCDPGYFYEWAELRGGALWPIILPGDLIRAWVVDTPAGPLFIAGITHPDGESLDREIRAIVKSITFD